MGNGGSTSALGHSHMSSFTSLPSMHGYTLIKLTACRAPEQGTELLVLQKGQWVHFWTNIWNNVFVLLSTASDGLSQPSNATVM